MLPQVRETYRKATGAELFLKADERAGLERLVRAEGEEAVVEAWRAYQTKKPGKPVRFFLEDFAQVRPRRRPPRVPCPVCGSTLYDGRACRNCFFEGQDPGEYRRALEVDPEPFYARIRRALGWAELATA